MDVLTQSALGGLGSGLIYALVAICIGIVYNATKILNFAQGEFIMFGAVFTWVAMQFGAPYLLAIPVGVVAGSLLAVVTEFLVITPVRRRNPPMWTYVFMLMGVHYVASQSIGLSPIGTDPLAVPSFLGDEPVRIGGAAVSSHYLVVIPAAIVIVVGIHLMFRHTNLGRSMRATASNESGARLVGISVASVARKAFLVCGIVSALLGALILPITTASNTMGLALTLKGFMGAIIGGLGNLKGAVVGGLAVGFLESVMVGLISYRWAESLIWATFALALLFLPHGLFGTTVDEPERV